MSSENQNVHCVQEISKAEIKTKWIRQNLHLEIDAIIVVAIVIISEVLL